MSPGRMPTFSGAVREALPACSRDGAMTSFSRGELAILVRRSARTISRWESLFEFRAERKNARVLRYPLETLVGVVALGATLNVAEAERRGLNAKAIIALASTIAPRSPPQTPTQDRERAVLVAQDDDDLRMIKAWRDPSSGPFLRKILRGLAAG